ncbi:MAG: GDP-mannose 4,6-dehydratase [Candidatus Levybacteria bacterium]|nr:GDP-mannose 4,6-dehydratase [Candidatus Levybacteria bacterium]
MKKVLITGASGFAGSFLIEHLLLNKSFQISGTFLLEKSLKNLIHVKNKINLIHLDLIDAEKVRTMIEKLRPDFIFHLAAHPSPMASFENPGETMMNNIKAQINILEAVKTLEFWKSRILVVSSAEIYGLVSPDDLPIDEKTELKPTSPYSVSKITQDFLGLQYYLAHKLKIVRVRPFNHIGPKQSPSFVVSAFAKKIAEIEKNNSEPVMSVGNLESMRDFTDVRDMIRAYVLAIEKGEAGDVYNIGSGQAYKISDILDQLISLSSKKIRVNVDEKLLRPIDIPELRCDAGKFQKLTGWKPEIPLEKTLEDTLDYWRNIT